MTTEKRTICVDILAFLILRLQILRFHIITDPQKEPYRNLSVKVNVTVLHLNLYVTFLTYQKVSIQSLCGCKTDQGLTLIKIKRVKQYSRKYVPSRVHLHTQGILIYCSQCKPRNTSATHSALTANLVSVGQYLSTGVWW